MPPAGMSNTATANAERNRAVRVLTLRGDSARDIAVRLGLSQRSVVRIRATLRAKGDLR